MEQWHCGSTGCIAGWALILSGYKKERIGFFTPAGELLRSGHSIITRTAELLGLERDIARRLCLLRNWPVDLLQRYKEGDNSTVLEALERALEGRL